MPTSPIIVQRVRSDGKINTFGYTSLTEIYANTISGDRVIYSGGDVDLASSGVQLKTGVKWLFLGNPTITSDAVAGTFYDNNSTVAVHFEGDLTIENTNGLASRIILQDSSSVINGFKWVFKGFLSQLSTSAPTAVVLGNTLGGTVVWSRVLSGQFLGTLAEAFNASKTFVSLASTFTFAVDEDGVRTDFGRASANTINVRTGIDSTGDFSDDVLSSTPITIEVYP